MTNDLLVLLINTIAIGFMLFQLINLFYIALFGGYGIRILDRHYSKAPEKELLDPFSTMFRYVNYCFKYPFGLLRTRSIWINLWMLQNSLFTITLVVGGTLGKLGVFD